MARSHVSMVNKTPGKRAYRCSEGRLDGRLRHRRRPVCLSTKSRHHFVPHCPVGKWVPSSNCRLHRLHAHTATSVDGENRLLSKRGFASLQARSTMLSMSAPIASSSHKLLVTTDGRPVANTTLLVRSSDDVSSQQSYYIFWSTCAC